MIDDLRMELASLYVVGELSAEQSARFEADLATDPELQTLVHEMSEAFASLSLARSLHTPPPGLKAKILGSLHEENSSRKVLRVSFVPWALAAALAVASTVLLLQQNHLKQEIASLQSRDAFSEMRVANLQAQVEAYSSSAAAVVWDEAQQKGRVRFEKLPVQEDKDYQLWVLDPQQKQPVNAGLVRVVNGQARSQEFRPAVWVGKDSKFAISLEPKGGSPQPAGQILFVGE